MNLISNASEALAGSSGSITVGTGARFCDGQLLQASRLEEKPPPGQYAFLEVRDTGCGMDSETQARLFDPFFTTKVAGRGLGMSAVLGIVRGHGGAILVGSELGSGTTVQVLLPRREQPVPKARRTEAAFPAGVAAANPWVLVVDDEASVRKLCMTYLKKLGLHVLGAAGGKEALELVGTHRERLACVLLDLTMPSMDGSAVFEEIRRLAPSLPVVLSSGYSRQEAVKRFSREDLAGFIQKPFRLKELKEAILPLLSR
jgi:two-component system cell cycle sensor histidine kinase/response regulator CckA